MLVVHINFSKMDILKVILIFFAYDSQKYQFAFTSKSLLTVLRNTKPNLIPFLNKIITWFIHFRKITILYSEFLVIIYKFENLRVNSCLLGIKCLSRYLK